MTTATAPASKKTFLKKVAETFNPAEDDGPIVYFINEAVLRDFDRLHNPVLEHGAAFLRIWKEETKFPIQDIPSLEFARKEPAKFFRLEYKTANEEKFKQLMGLDIDFTTIIKLPENFDRVVTAARPLNRWAEHVDMNKTFRIDGDELVITDAAYQRRNRKAYWTASTPDEKRNLKIAEGIRDAMEKLAEVVPAGKKSGQRAIENKSYVHPLPFPLQLVTTKTGNALIPNPSFVRNGFAATTILGFYLETDKDKENAKKDEAHKLGPRMKKILKKDQFGFPTNEYIVCLPEDVDKYIFGPNRLNQNEVLKGDFNMDGQPYGTPLKMDTIIGATSWGEKMLTHGNESNWDRR